MSLDQEHKPKPAGDSEAPIQAKRASDPQAGFMQQSLSELGAQSVQRKVNGPSVQQQSVGEIGSAVQRSALEAEGGESEESELDAGVVQQTAEDGVAGASSPLPHGEAIQQAFGSHDVSGVQAQVGGSAATATASLGANAYATGDKVAFGAAPDLHTAAHEAAHVVQQKSGKVDKGLGPAGDPHEREADAVADKVVAGQSAEPLLDQMAGGAQTAAGAGAVQLDRKAKPVTAQSARTDLVRLALRNAEGEARQFATAADKKRVVFDTRTHLNEAALAYAKGIDLVAVQAQMDATSLALKPLRDLGAKSEHADGIKQIGEQEQKIRSLLQMPAAPAAGTKATKAKDLDEQDAAGPAIDHARFEAEAAYDQLVAIDMKNAKWRKDASASAKDDKLQLPPADNREQVVNRASSTLQQHLGYAQTALGDAKAAESSALKPKIEAASAPMQKIRSWIYSRQANVGSLSTFDLALNEFDSLRVLAGMGPLAREDFVNLARVSDEEKDEELRDIGKAEKDYGTALAGYLKGFEIGADRFEKFAHLKRPPSPPSFWAELAKGILVSIVGNLAGPVTQMIFAKAKGLSKDTIDLVAGMTVDSVEAIGGKIADDAFSKTASENADIRAARLFNEHMIGTQANLHTQALRSMSTRVRAKNVSAQQLVDMTKDLEARGGDTAAIADLAYREVSAGYALFNAQQNLKGSATDKVSNMDDYFGKKENVFMSSPRTVGNKEGTTGVAKIELDIEDPAEYRDSRFKQGDFASTQITSFEINGLSDDLAKATLEHAKFKLLDLNMPIEIHLTPPWWGKKSAKPALAIDEAGNLRSARGWEAFDPTYFSATAGGGEGRRKQAKNADFYSSPQKLWAAIRDGNVPASTLKK